MLFERFSDVIHKPLDECILRFTERTILYTTRSRDVGIDLLSGASQSKYLL